MVDLMNALIMTFVIASGVAMVLGTICVGCTVIEFIYFIGKAFRIALASEFEE